VSEGHAILIAGALLLAALGASLAASRLRLPALLLFLALGMVVGSDGTRWIVFNDYNLARDVGTAALALILFDGGLSSGFNRIRPVLRTALKLAIGGTLVTALVCGVIAAPLFGISPLYGLLLGAMLASTDSAAIFGLLRESTLHRRLARTLEGEAGLNDPVAVLLVLGFVQWIAKPDYGVADMFLLFVRQLGIGAVCGITIGALSAEALRRVRLPNAGLYPVASFTTAALAFGSAESLSGSGFLAVYIAGLLLGDAPIAGRQTIAAFHEGAAWVAQILLFLTLGLLVSPSQLVPVAGQGIALALVLMFLARPLGVALATAADRFTGGERIILSWAGLRGAVPVVLATFPVTSGTPGSANFFNVVFFVVVISTLAQGISFEPLARSLRLTAPEPVLPRPMTEFGTIQRLGAEVLEFPVYPTDTIVGRRVRDLGLPHDATLSLIVRGVDALPPRGSTEVAAGDTLHLIIRHEVAGRMPDLLASWRGGSPAAQGAQPAFTRAWTEHDGDPADPDLVGGIPVIGVIRARAGFPAALVALEDGCFAVTGPTLVAGSPGQLIGYAQARLAAARDAADRGWWGEVALALGG
jgi:cell volume regulation protein A